MAQFARPSADTATGGWTTQAGSATNLYAVLDETAADDGDYARLGSPNGEILKVALSDIADPQSATGHVVRYRIGKAGTGTVNFTVSLMQDTTEIASWSHRAVDESFTTYEQTLTADQANAITDYAALALWFVGSPPTYWLDDQFDRRIVVEATNAQSIPLHDHLIDVTVPAGIDADSIRVVEITSLDSVDKAYDWRYATGGTTVNHFWFLPCSLSGTTLTIKTLGKWAASATRYFAVYWDSTSTVAATAYTHLNGIVQTWSVVITAGDTGNTYTLNMGGATYSHVMTAGQTANQISLALETLIDGGAVATASVSSGTITITQVTKLDGTFAVTSTGSILTGSGAIAITRPNFFGLGRVGPDTTVFSATYAFIGLPAHNPASGALTRPAFGRSGTGTAVGRLGVYNINGTGAQVPTGATITSVVNDGPKIRAEGAITWTSPKWSGTYAATIHNKIVTGRKSDDTGADAFAKYVDAIRLVLTYTCTEAYTPAAVAAGATTLGTHELLALASTVNSFAGNVTELGPSGSNNMLPNFYGSVASATPTVYTSASAATLAGLTVDGSIIGTHGNSNGIGIAINSVTISNFSPQSVNAAWTTQGNAFGILQLRGLSTGSQVPVGATVVIDCWIVAGHTTGASSVGDNLLPDEVIAVLRSLANTQPTITVSDTESLVTGLDATMDLASDRVVEGIDWLFDNGAALTTVADNPAYNYNVQSTAITIADDDDGNYGVGHMLHGLCLKYLRTGDAALIPHIERCVEFHIDIEQGAVSAYGSWWEGSAPFWYWPSAIASDVLTPTNYQLEGGIAGGDTDPNFNGGVKAPIVYTQGDIRRQASIDQMHMVAHGLYAYLYLLRNEAAITANTTLRTNALSLLARMETFEADHFTASARVIANLSDICAGGTPVFANGITDTELNDSSAAALANPYWGVDYLSWNVNNTDAVTIAPSANTTLVNFFRATYAPGSTLAGTVRYLKGQAMDMLASDAAHHDVTFGTATWNTAFTSSAFPPYPYGWLMRGSASGNTYEYQNGRTGDDHFIALTSAARDHMSGRAAQRLVVLCLLALLDDPDYEVPVENASTTVLRSIPLRTAIDEAARVIATYGIEPTTKAQRYVVPGWLGVTTNFKGQQIDAAFTGYWMMAVELWHLVNSGADYADYYPIGSW